MISCVLGGPAQLTSAADRAAGFIGALRKHDLSRGPCCTASSPGTAGTRRPGGRSPSSGRPPRAGVLLRGQRRDGAGRDDGAAGRRPARPDDVQVAGFDDIPTLRDLTPGLTTVRLPLQSMGEQAVALAIGGRPAGTG